MTTAPRRLAAPRRRVEGAGVQQGQLAYKLYQQEISCVQYCTDSVHSRKSVLAPTTLDSDSCPRVLIVVRESCSFFRCIRFMVPSFSA